MMQLTNVLVPQALQPAHNTKTKANSVTPAMPKTDSFTSITNSLTPTTAQTRDGYSAMHYRSFSGGGSSAMTLYKPFITAQVKTPDWLKFVSLASCILTPLSALGMEAQRSVGIFISDRNPELVEKAVKKAFCVEGKLGEMSSIFLPVKASGDSTVNAVKVGDYIKGIQYCEDATLRVMRSANIGRLPAEQGELSALKNRALGDGIPAVSVGGENYPIASVVSPEATVEARVETLGNNLGCSLTHEGGAVTSKNSPLTSESTIFSNDRVYLNRYALNGYGVPAVESLRDKSKGNNSFVGWGATVALPQCLAVASMVNNVQNVTAIQAPKTLSETSLDPLELNNQVTVYQTGDDIPTVPKRGNQIFRFNQN